MTLSTETSVKPKWYHDLTSPLDTKLTSQSSASSDLIKVSGKIAEPSGFFFDQPSGQQEQITPSIQLHNKRELAKKQKETDDLKIRRARELSFAPAKGLLPNLLMSYFSGSSLQVLTLTMTWMMFFNGPITQIISVSDQFAKFETESNKTNIFVFKAIFCFFQTITMCVGIYKLSSMGILPNTASDWVAWEVPSKVRIIS